jgi:hypothetical protein
MSMNCTQAKENITACIQAKLVPFLRGSPGVGKSSIVSDIAKDFNLKFIDFRLSQADPVDLNGFPTIDPVTKTASYVPMDVFPIESTKLPIKTPEEKDAAGNVITPATYYDGWLLFLDEFNSASLAVQKATYKVVLDRMIGQHKIHDRVAMVCAGNLETDNAITSKLSTAMQSRLIHFELHTDAKEWVQWAASANIDVRITSYINFKPEALNMFAALNKSQSIENTFPCQRTWEFVHRLIKKIPVLNNSHGELLSGAIGSGTAHEFIGFTKIFQDLPSIDDIIKNPMHAKVPTEASSRYAVTGLLSHHATDANGSQILAYASRLPTEFTVLTLQDALRRNPSFINSKAVSEWVAQNYSDIY